MVKVRVKPGYGYYDLQHYPWGGDFRRSTNGGPEGEVESIEGRQIVFRDAQGRRYGAYVEAVEQIP